MHSNRLFVVSVVVGLAGLVAGARAAEMVDNPNYQEWAKFKPGTFVTLKTTGTTTVKGAGGAADLAAIETRMSITQKLISLDGEKAVVETIQTTITGGNERTMPARKGEIPAKVEKRREDMPPAAGKDDKEEVSDVKTGTDTVEYKGRKLATTTEEKTTKMVGSGLKIHTKTWRSDEVPGNLVKMESTQEGPMTGNSKTELVDFAVVK